jgi:hypothetical protein
MGRGDEQNRRMKAKPRDHAGRSNRMLILRLEGAA